MTGRQAGVPHDDPDIRRSQIKEIEMATAKNRPTRKPISPEEMPLEGHEDFYKRLRDKITMWADRNQIKPVYRKYLLALPDLFHLIARLVLDKRMDATAKTILAVALAYAVSPFDLLPDFLGPLGFVDDLLVIALAIETVLLRVPKKVLTEHWAGEGDIVELVRDIREAADRWVGRGMYLRIREYLAARGIGKSVPPVKAKSPARRAKAAAKVPAKAKPAAAKTTAKVKAAVKAKPKPKAPAAARKVPAAARKAPAPGRKSPAKASPARKRTARARK